MVVAFGPGRSSGARIDGVRALGISSVSRPMSSPQSLGHDGTLSVSPDSGCDLSLGSFAFLLQFPDLCLQPLQAFLQDFSCLLHQTLNGRGEISGTHGYSVVIEQFNRTTLVNINRT